MEHKYIPEMRQFIFNTGPPAASQGTGRCVNDDDCSCFSASNFPSPFPSYWSKSIRLSQFPCSQEWGWHGKADFQLSLCTESLSSPKTRGHSPLLFFFAPHSACSSALQAATIAGPFISCMTSPFPSERHSGSTCKQIVFCCCFSGNQTVTLIIMSLTTLAPVYHSLLWEWEHPVHSAIRHFITLND